MNRLPGFLIVAFWWWVLSLTAAVAAEKFIIMTPGPSVPYTPLHYGVDAGFFKEQGIDLQVLAVRAGQIGVASLTSGEVDAITHAGTAVAAAIRGLPVKVISVSNERPNHEMLVRSNGARPPGLERKITRDRLIGGHRGNHCSADSPGQRFESRQRRYVYQHGN